MTTFLQTQVHLVGKVLRSIEVFHQGSAETSEGIREALQAIDAIEIHDRTGTKDSVFSSEQSPRIVLDLIAQARAAVHIIGHDDILFRDITSRIEAVLDTVGQRAGADIRSANATKIRGLYVIVDPEVTDGRPAVRTAEAALRGGAAMVQLRDKSRDRGVVLREAREIKALCDDHGALFIMNDDAGLALAAGAHGLHVGQSDLPVEDARTVLNPRQLVGRSNNTVGEVSASMAAGVDYLAVGAIYATLTGGKAARPVVGVELVRKVRGMTSIPIVAIGGIKASNVAEVVRAGADAVCVVSAVTMADDPEQAARGIEEKMRETRNLKRET